MQGTIAVMNTTTRDAQSAPPTGESSLSAEVRRVRDRIVETYSPERIILFGSHATGTALPDSDIDLLIIKRTRKPYLDRLLAVRLTLDWRTRADVMVLTPEELENAISEDRYFMVKEILPKGRVIYERPRTRRRHPRVA